MHPLGGRACAALTSALLLISCGSDGGSKPPDAGSSFDANPGAPATADYEAPTPGAGAPWGQLPFPNDLYLDDTGHIALTTLPSGPDAATNFEAMLLEAVSEIDGAGPWTNVYFPIDGALDPQSLAGNAVLLDLASGDPIAADLRWRSDLGAVVVAPLMGIVLEEKHRYAAYVTDGIRSADGVPLRASADFAAVVATDPPTDPAQAAARESLQPLLDQLGAQAEHVVAATVFRTATISDDLIALRTANKASPPPIAITQVITDPTEIYGVQAADAPPGLSIAGPRPQPSSHIRAIVHGTITLPNYWSTDPHEPDRLHLDGSGVPVLQSTDTVPFTLHLPIAGDYSDLPVIAYQHGIGTSRGRSVAIADTAAGHGIAMIAIDLPYHGSRAVDATDNINNVTREAIPDGFGEENAFSTVRFFHLVPGGSIPAYHPTAMRENLRRAASDFDALIAFVRDGDVGPLNTALAAESIPPVTFRDTDIGVVSTSLGSMVAIMTTSVEPDVSAAVFTVPAAGFPFPSLLYSYVFGPNFETVVYDTSDVASEITLGDPDKDPRFHPIVVLWNYALAPADSMSYAPHFLDGAWREGKRTHIFLSMAHSDEWVPNAATATFAYAMGMPRMTIANDTQLPTPLLPLGIDLPTVAAPVSGNLAGGQTAALMEVYPCGHGYEAWYEDDLFLEPNHPPFVELNPPLRITAPTKEWQEQWTSFMEDALNGITPTLVDPTP